MTRSTFEDLYFYPVNDANTSARSVESRERGWATQFASNQVAELRRDLPGFVHVAPYLMSQFYSFNTTRPPFNDKRVRLALSMALDRDFIAHQIFKTSEQPAYALVPPGIANYAPTAQYAWANQPLAARRAQALSLPPRRWLWAEQSAAVRTRIPQHRRQSGASPWWRRTIGARSRRG